MVILGRADLVAVGGCGSGSFSGVATGICAGSGGTRTIAVFEIAKPLTVLLSLVFGLGFGVTRHREFTISLFVEEKDLVDNFG